MRWHGLEIQAVYFSGRGKMPSLWPFGMPKVWFSLDPPVGLLGLGWY